MANLGFIRVQIDPAQAERIQRLFAEWPQAILRIFVESLNKCANKARTDLVTAGFRLTGIPKHTIRRFTSIKRANRNQLWAYVRAFSRNIPIRYMDMDPGPERPIWFLTSFRQAVWLFYNVFKPKYGESAVFCRRYSIKRMTRDIFYRLNGRPTLAPKNSFLATMPSGYTGAFTRKNNSPRALKEIAGPSLGQLLIDNRVEIQEIEKKAGEMLHPDIDKRIARYLKMRNQRRMAAMMDELAGVAKEMVGA